MVNTDDLSHEMKVFYHQYRKENHKMNLQDKLREGLIPQVDMVFTFPDGSNYTMHIIEATEGVKGVGLDHIPTFSIADDGHGKLVTELFRVEVDYGEGIYL